MEDKTFTQDDVDRIVQERLARDRQTRVTHEPRVYAADSPHSFYADAVALRVGGMNAGDARERMERYARELGSEMSRGTPEGRHAERVIRAHERTHDMREHEERVARVAGEMRALGTGGGATASAVNGAAFVSPYFLIADWAPFRGIARSFADQCFSASMPAYGMEIYVPAMASPTGVSQQTEGELVTETDPETTFESAAVETITGRINLTQQLADRGMSGGGSMDRVIHAQLHEQLDQEIDAYTLTQVTAHAAAVEGATEYKTVNLYADLAKGREELKDTAGVRLRPTHCFTTSDFYGYATRQVTSTELPIVEARFVPGFPLPSRVDDFNEGEKAKWSRFTGTVLPGGVLWFTDDNIQAVGTTTKTQILVSAPAVSVILVEDDPVFGLFTETLANELKVVLLLREYVAAVTRHPKGTAVITGAAYTTALK